MTFLYPKESHFHLFTGFLALIKHFPKDSQLRWFYLQLERFCVSSPREI